MVIKHIFKTTSDWLLYLRFNLYICILPKYPRRVAGNKWSVNCVTEMADEVEYLPLYEVVDRQQETKLSQTSAIKLQSKYEPLSSTAQKMNIYQQLETKSSHHGKVSDTAHELKLLKRDLKLTKIAATVGLILVVCVVVAGIAVAMVTAVHPTISKSNNTAANNPSMTTLSNNYSGLPWTIFQNCQQEIQSCDIMHQLDNRVTCNAGYLQIQKEVSSSAFFFIYL